MGAKYMIPYYLYANTDETLTVLDKVLMRDFRNYQELYKHYANDLWTIDQYCIAESLWGELYG
jgi:hypothetical protein